MSKNGNYVNTRRRSAHIGRRDDLAPPSFMIWVVLLFVVASFAQIEWLITLKIGLIALIAIVIAMGVKRNWVWTRSHTVMVVFLLLAASSMFYAYNNYQAYRITLIYIPFVGVAIAFAWMMATPKGRNRVVAVWLLTLAYVGIYAIFHSGGGPGGYVSDENDMALTVAMGLPFALFGLESQRPMIKIGSWVLTFIFVAASVASFSRGGMIAMASGVLFYLLYTQHKFRKSLLVATLILMILSLAPDRYLSELKSIRGELTANSEFSTGTIRRFMWATGVNAFMDNPILGVGAGNYPMVVGVYQPTKGNWPDAFFNRGRTMQSAHSFYIQILAEHGLAGIVLFGFLIKRFFSNLHRIVKENMQAEANDTEIWGHLSPRLLSLALMGSMIAFLSAGIFLSVLAYPHFYYLIGMGAGLEAATRRDPGSEMADDEELAGHRKIGKAGPI